MQGPTLEDVFLEMKTVNSRPFAYYSFLLIMVNNKIKMALVFQKKEKEKN